MLERETANIIATLTERAIGSAQSLALKDAIAANLPKSIKLYLQCEVMRWLHNDLKNESHFSNIPSGVPLVHHLTKLYTRSLAPEYIFTRKEFVNTLENAVHFVENYLCRPQWTLVQFVFEKSECVTLAELQTRFEYLSDYLYYSTLVFGFMRQKGMQEISVEEFRSLLQRIDNQVTQRHSPKELALLARPIFEFLLVQSATADTAIPIRPLTVFFDDKRMNTVKEYVESICRIRNTEVLTIGELAGVIEDLYGDTGPEQTVAKNLPLQPDTPALQQDDGAMLEVPSELGISADGDNSAPLTSHPIMGATPRSDGATGTALPGPDRRNIALSLTFSGLTSPTNTVRPSASLPDLKHTISEDQRKRFVQKIFQKDESYFNVVIETLNGMSTWKDAALYLQTFYQTSGVDPFVQDVVEFTDLIQHRYSA